MSETPYSIDIGPVLRDSTGNTNSLLHNLVRGKNWLGGPPKVPEIRDDVGLIFMTKPDFNLKAANIGMHRHFSPLLNTGSFSLGALLRDTLDPRSVHESGVPNSMLNDPLNPFVSFFDNTVLDCSGWPDYVSNEYVSNPGKRGAQFGLYSGTIQDALKFPLNFNNRNIPGDLIGQYLLMFQRLGEQTMHNIFPHSINVWKDQIGAASRIFRFAFNEVGTKVVQFTMCGYAYPRSTNIGSVMNYSVENSRNQGYDEVASEWSAFGVFHNDPIVINEFNLLVTNFNPLMRDDLRERFMTRIGVPGNSRQDAGRFTGYGYPRIDPRSLDFEIWVPNNQFAAITANNSSEEVIAAINTKLLSDYSKGVSNLTPEERDAIFA